MTEDTTPAAHRESCCLSGHPKTKNKLRERCSQRCTCLVPPVRPSPTFNVDGNETRKS